MNPARKLAEWINGCDEHGRPGPGRTRRDVEFYTGLYTVTGIAALVIIAAGVITSIVSAILP